MLSVFCLTPVGLKRLQREAQASLPEDAVWLDLLEPTQNEERLVEARLGIEIPTREEMSEIESSSRLYEEEGGLYLTVTVVTKLDSELPENAQVTFILKDNRLVTNRYVDPLPFRRFTLQLERHPQYQTSAQTVFVGLLEYIVNRIADVIERVGTDIDRVTAEVFNQRGSGNPARTLQRDYRKLLERTGQAGELIAKARESLASLSRLLAFVQQSSVVMTQDVRTRLRTLSKDVVAMSDHASFLNSNLNFVLDATLGMINIDQNNILKIFSVVTVFLLPPSVIAGIFGMNFAQIPASQQPWGFAGALVLMVLSALLPWAYFKHRGWL
ncbi:MAG: magnesium transporter CorA family protein [Nevskiaceae bacterium]|nr:magnesium transporter CorA family protein [Nevskiaceae bacterium]